MANRERCSLVEVEWRDSAAKGGWSWDADGEPAVCHSTGYLLKDEREYILLSQSLSDTSGQYGNMITIPKFAVTWIRNLNGV